MHALLSRSLVAAVLVLQVSGGAVQATPITSAAHDDVHARESSGAGPIGYWPLNGNGDDASGNGYSLALPGNPGFAPGIIGQSLALTDQPGQYAIGASDSAADDARFGFGGGDFTIQAWINLNREDGVFIIAEKFKGETGPGWTLYSVGQYIQFYVDGASTFLQGLPASSFVGGWHQVVVRRSGSTFSLLVDDVLLSSGAVDYVFQPTTNALEIGQRNADDGRNYDMDGKIDEVAIWDRALSDAEVSSLYNGGLGRPASTANGVPASAECSSVVYVPAQKTFGSLLFEDNWPNNGDLDFNDQTIAYNYELALDASKSVVALYATFDVLAVGANFQNGLYLRLPGVSPSTIASAMLVASDGTSAPATLIIGEPDVVIQITPDTRTLFAHHASFNFINTDPALPTQTASRALQVQIKFNAATSLDTSAAPYDLFIARTANYDWQIHLPIYSGTALAQVYLATLFGTGADGSNQGRNKGRYFVNTSGMPFALDVPEAIKWAVEKKPIDDVYLDLGGFASSAGKSNKDWYSSGHVDTSFQFTSGGGSPPPAPVFTSATGPLASCPATPPSGTTSGYLVTEFYAGKVMLVRPDGTTSTLVDNLANPDGIALTADGSFALVERSANRLLRLKLDGTFSVITAGLPSGTVGVAVDLDGTFLVSERDAGQIVRVNSSGAITPFVTLDSPVAVAVVGDGTYYVAEEFSHVIAHLAQDGSLIASFPQPYGQPGPSSVAVDTAGNVIVDDAFNGTLRRLTPADGVSMTVQLSVPVGIVLDVDGSYVTTDQQRGQLLRVQPDGSVTVIAGGLDGAEFVARF